MTIRVLLVDDSAVIRGLMARAFAAEPAIEVIGSAVNGVVAIDLAKHLQPDIIILDIQMPVMDGVTALPNLLRIAPACKVIMSSTLTVANASISLKALELGAADYIAKPSTKTGDGVEGFYRELIAKVKAIAGKKFSSVSVPTPIVANPKTANYLPPTASIDAAHTIVLQDANTPLHVTGVKALAIASSTGGPQALMTLFESLKGRLLGIPIFITQHMPPNFTAILADHLTKSSGRPCHESKTGIEVKAGEMYLAAGDYHMIPEKTLTGQIILQNSQSAPENFCRPAADPMLRALSRIYGKHLAVVVLTGMGQDAMLGGREVVKNGGSVIAQNEATCIVYGMPRAVVENQLCRAVLPIEEIGSYLIKQIEGK